MQKFKNQHYMGSMHSLYVQILNQVYYEIINNI